MSKEEFLKIKTCVLKVNIHCDGCKQKVKKILQKIDGVYTTSIDSEQGKVTVSGNFDPATLIKKLSKKGKYAEMWGAPKAQLNNQLKNQQIDNGKGGNNKVQQGQKGGNNQPKGGQNAQLQQLQQLPQLQQLKGLQDLKMPPQFMKDLKVPIPINNNKEQNQKSAKYNALEDEGLTDDELDEFDDDELDEFDDEDQDDDVFGNEVEDTPLNKPKLPMGNGHGGAQMPNMMLNKMADARLSELMKAGAIGGSNGGGNGKIGGGGKMPVMVNIGGGNDGKGGGASGGKKGGNGSGNGGNAGNQNQGGGKGGKNGGGQPPQDKNGGGNGQNKNGNAGGGGGYLYGGYNMNANGAKKGGGMNDGIPGMPNIMAMNAGANVGHIPTGQMGPMGNVPMGQIRNLSAVQGLPASAMNGGSGGGAGGGPGQMAAHPYYQQQMAAMMMNQHHANGNERFQPMMYAPPPPAVNYMPPYPYYPYPPPGEHADQYSTFSDENPSSCTMM